LPGNHRRPGPAAFENRLRGLQNQVGLGFGLIVAGEAVVLRMGSILVQNRSTLSVDLRDANRRTLVLGGLRFLPRQREATARERDDQWSRGRQQFSVSIVLNLIASVARLELKRPATFWPGACRFEDIGRIAGEPQLHEQDENLASDISSYFPLGGCNFKCDRRRVKG